MIKPFSSSLSLPLSLTQRQLLAQYISVFCAAFLLLVLIGLVGFMVWRGSAFIWPNPIYSLTYQNQAGQTGFGYAQYQTILRKDKAAWFGVSSFKQPFQAQIILADSQVLTLEKAPSVAEIKLVDGRVILAKPLSLVTPQETKVNIELLESQRMTVGILDAKILQLREVNLSPLHEELAAYDRRGVAPDAPARLKLEQAYSKFQREVVLLEQSRDQYQLVLGFFEQHTLAIPLSKIDRLSFPSDMTFVDKLKDALIAFGYFLSEPPKQANTAGGVFPALFGTVVMVFLMTIIVAPFGVLAAVYLHEYAPKNMFTSTIRICVSNMAAVPSIVYGVFGLGFLVYSLGGNLDSLFFSDVLPNPTMGTPGLFWAAVTMALLTLPVVIVATEEGLSRVPQGLRKGSYALGATKIETIWHTVLPLASPSIMTGLILAIARAAGEVAPLMLVGAVRFAPNLPVDGSFPFLHLDRQFMHLGVLIYDGAFHSQTSAKGASMMFAACSLLLLVVLILNIVAVVLRARLRERFQ